MGRIQIHYPETTLYIHRIPIRITDLNYGNHLAHDVLVSILHEARARFFKAYAMEEGDIDGMGILIVDLGVIYRSQVFYGQTLEVEVAISDVASRGCDLVYRVSDQESGKLVATAKTGIVFFDYKKNCVVGIPESFKALINKNGKPRE
ncbi:MAG: thioesterase family protein [Candidatus Eisenbacteria bacterium]|uniref:Thioesterase family protein n=1 Tax=Eiseniibacteriota bacterium TaxID=2212470 RepID=A0A948W7V8_UNCEI|nr:thioesterase family protein [Candidatus Eisenbacteria bacterium]MBU1948131.1 thioesterase family protein [Candidatus Eisenbacteria bacterium]MBU2692665.1 thioesterase family protein [Candidatus Eisenbacteria bacterium]